MSELNLYTFPNNFQPHFAPTAGRTGTCSPPQDLGSRIVSRKGKSPRKFPHLFLKRSVLRSSDRGSVFLFDPSYRIFSHSNLLPPRRSIFGPIWMMARRRNFSRCQSSPIMDEPFPHRQIQTNKIRRQITRGPRLQISHPRIPILLVRIPRVRTGILEN